MDVLSTIIRPYLNIRDYVDYPWLRETCVAGCKFLVSDEAQVLVLVCMALVALVVARIVVHAFSIQWIEEGKRTFFRVLKSLPLVKGKVAKEKAKVLEKMEKMMVSRGESPLTRLPEKGMNPEAVLQQMRKCKDKDTDYRRGRVSGVVYVGDTEHVELMSKAYALFSLSNPLHPNTFPSTRQFEAEIISMCVEMMNGKEQVCGCMTSGGTESILMAMKAYRDWGREMKGITKPEIVAAVSGHAAFDKAAGYFGMKITHVPVDGNYQMDLRAARRAITKNTVVIVGSCPGYPHGIIDPLEELSELARARGIGMHVDACLGGFHVPWLARLGHVTKKFDFRLPGVTSMSADIHKYGFGTKGTSVILYRTPDLRRYQYFAFTEWTGGLYCSPTMAGSRPGGLVAAAWASMVHLGEEGYLRIAEQIWKNFKKLRDGIPQIPKLQLVGSPDACVVAFKSDELDVFKVADALEKNGYSVDRMQRPPSVHLCVTQQNCICADDFLVDLRQAAEAVAKDPKGHNEGLAPIYGLAGSMADRALLGDIMNGYMDLLYKV